MRASLKNYMAACNRRKEETGESGFSLIELIVVVVILGILAAIAVPVFTGLQAQAEDSAVKTVAANGATQVAAQIAKSTTPVQASAISFGNLNQDGVSVTLKTPASGALDIGNYCVEAVKGDTKATSGPGCPAAPAAG